MGVVQQHNPRCKILVGITQKIAVWLTIRVDIQVSVRLNIRISTRIDAGITYGIRICSLDIVQLVILAAICQRCEWQ